jgi:hypothetical protein
MLHHDQPAAVAAAMERFSLSADGPPRGAKQLPSGGSEAVALANEAASVGAHV